MKILKSNSISPFGGLNFVLEHLQKLKLDELLKNELPSLPKQSAYEWKDILYSFFLSGDDPQLKSNFIVPLVLVMWRFLVRCENHFLTTIF